MNCHNLMHSPVLQKEVLAILFFEKVQTVFDGTVGLGGHAESILASFPSISRYIACDLDSQHLAFAKKRLQKWEEKTDFHQVNFSHIADILEQKKIEHPLVILLDLGICSNHVDDPQKGFSFQADGPLHMAFRQQEKALTAEKVLNTYSEKDLEKILKHYGEEPSARKIAHNIVVSREKEPLKTTYDLRGIVEKSVHPKDRNKSLMRVFQAIRIEVNDELSHLEMVLKKALECLYSGDRLGIISYHALEDRIVKTFFKSVCRPKTTQTPYSLHTEIAPALAQEITKKPISPSDKEIQENPRSRSARFRILQKI